MHGMMTLHVILELPVHVIFLRSLTIVYLSIGGVHCTAATADDDSLVGYTGIHGMDRHRSVLPC